MIKTRLMLQSDFIPNGHRYQYKGLTDGLRSIYIKDGLLLI